MKLLIMQFSPTSCHFISLWSKYSPQHPAPQVQITDLYYKRIFTKYTDHWYPSMYGCAIFCKELNIVLKNLAIWHISRSFLNQIPTRLIKVLSFIFDSTFKNLHSITYNTPPQTELRYIIHNHRKMIVVFMSLEAESGPPNYIKKIDSMFPRRKILRLISSGIWRSLVWQINTTVKSDRVLHDCKYSCIYFMELTFYYSIKIHIKIYSVRSVSYC
jgi:hypothetical protein